MALGQVFPEYFGFPLSILFHRCSITREKKKLIIFIIGLHNKRQYCGASVASAAGPFATKKTFDFRCKLAISVVSVHLYCTCLLLKRTDLLQRKGEILVQVSVQNLMSMERITLCVRARM
jgi:hypothetical protein